MESSHGNPIPKSEDKNKVDNYRPISVIRALSKTMEKALIYTQLLEYLEKNYLLSNSQIGYRKYYSTELATTLLLDKIRINVDNSKLTGAVLIHLPKTLGHSKLLAKKKSYDLEDIDLEWFSNYLFRRAQKVKVNETQSKRCSVFCGVLNDFPDNLTNLEVI